MMKSNPSPEELILASKISMSSGLRQVAQSIDKLSSANLKRVLKIVSHVHVAQELTGQQSDISLNDDEQNLIDRIFALQESVLGHSQLIEEAKTAQETNVVDNTINNTIGETNE